MVCSTSALRRRRVPGASVGAIRTLSSRATRRSRSQRPLQPLPHCASAGRTSSGAYTRSILSSARAAAAKCTSSASSPDPCRSRPSWIISAGVISSPAHLRTPATLWPAPLEGSDPPCSSTTAMGEGGVVGSRGPEDPHPCPKGPLLASRGERTLRAGPRRTSQRRPEGIAAEGYMRTAVAPHRTCFPGRSRRPRRARTRPRSGSIRSWSSRRSGSRSSCLRFRSLGARVWPGADVRPAGRHQPRGSDRPERGSPDLRWHQSD